MKKPFDIKTIQTLRIHPVRVRHLKDGSWRHELEKYFAIIERPSLRYLLSAEHSVLGNEEVLKEEKPQ